jgi:hypothetical protein
MADAKEGGAPTVKLQFHYIKGPTYREEACHGVIGGHTPQGGMWVSFYTERYPIPRITEYDVAGKPGEAVAFNEQDSTPSNVETRQGVIRHVETTIYMETEVAKRIHAWLGKHIDALEKMKTGK